MRNGLRGLRDGVHSLCDCMGRFIFRASLAAVLNEEAGQDPALFDAFNSFDNPLPLLLAGVPSFCFADFERNRETLAGACSKYTQNISELMEKRWEYFSSLEKEGKMIKGDASRVQLAILWASVGNTMPGTFWLVYYLLTHPEARHKVVKEIKRVIPDIKERFLNDVNLSYEELSQMVYLDACITEALRLSSGSLIMRACNRACAITLDSGKTYRFRKGDRIALCPPVLHRDEEIYPQAKSFRPERWLLPEVNPSTSQDYSLQERVQAAQGKVPFFKGGREVPSSSVFLAFGAGLSHCPGRRFARNELKCLLAYIFGHLDLSLVEPDLPPPGVLASRAGLGVFPPARDLLVNVSHRL